MMYFLFFPDNDTNDVITLSPRTSTPQHSSRAPRSSTSPWTSTRLRNTSLSPRASTHQRSSRATRSSTSPRASTWLRNTSLSPWASTPQRDFRTQGHHHTLPPMSLKMKIHVTWPVIILVLWFDWIGETQISWARGERKCCARCAKISHKNSVESAAAIEMQSTILHVPASMGWMIVVWPP